MPTDDYTPLVRGGLKLKGSKPVGVKKPKSKSKKPKNPSSSSSSASISNPKAASPAPKVDNADKADKVQEQEEEEETELRLEKLKELDPRDDTGKTATERAYEDMRRKRLQDRLLKEGTKTHKQKVEELNKYLSNLSEHHDMPRIGPG